MIEGVSLRKQCRDFELLSSDKVDNKSLSGDKGVVRRRDRFFRFVESDRFLLFADIVLVGVLILIFAVIGRNFLFFYLR